jgi:hypothetical protein
MADDSKKIDRRFAKIRKGGFLTQEDVNRVRVCKNIFENSIKRRVITGWQWCRNRPLVALALGGPATIATMGVIFWLLGEFTIGGGTDWTAVKEYIQTCGYLFGATGIGLGLHYAGRRTDAMTAANEIQGLARRNDSFVNAINKLESKHSSLRIAAIKSLERLAKETDREFYDETIAVLANFLVRQSWESNEEDQTKDLDVGKNEIELGFRSLCAIQDAHADISNSKLTEIDLSSINLTSFKDHSRMNINSFIFNNAYLSHCHFGGVLFKNVQISNSKLTRTSFDRSLFLNCSVDFFNPRDDAQFLDISGANFTYAEISQRRFRYSAVEYHVLFPPVGLPAGTILPPPKHYFDERSLSLSLSEAEEYWNKPECDKYRPRDRNGNLIEILDRDKDGIPTPYPDL